MKFKKLLFILPLTLIIFIIAGCSSSKTQVNENVVGEFDNAPTWINSKQIEGKVSELGNAKKRKLNFAQQRDRAITNAQENLSKKLHLKIIEIFKLLNEPSIDQELYNKQMLIATDEIMQNASNSFKIRKLWQSETKTIYVLVSIDIKTLKEAIKFSTSTTLKDIPAISSNYSMQLEQGNIDLKLSN